jgi:hypothetical protein
MPPTPGESRAADAVTAIWMLSVANTLLCFLGALAALLFAALVPNSPRAAMLVLLLLMAGAVIGAVSLLLVPLVYRLRSSPPPRTVTVVAMAISLAPAATLLLLRTL